MCKLQPASHQQTPRTMPAKLHKVNTYKDFILYILHVFGKDNFIRIHNRLSTFYNFITTKLPFSASLLPHPLLYLYTTHPVELSFLLLVKLFCADYWWLVQFWL